MSKKSISTLAAILLATFLSCFIISCTSTQEEAYSKWLPGKNTTTISAEVDNFLGDLNGNIRLLHCQYDGARLVEINNFNSNGLLLKDEEWQTTINTSIDDSDLTAMDLHIRFSLKKGSSSEGGVAVAFDFDKWSPENYVMIPASVYNGNRCKIVEREYASGIDRKYLYQKDIPMMSVPIPQLSPDEDSLSRLEVNACNTATPAMCFYSREKKHGFILLTNQKTQFSDNGFIVEESKDRQLASFVVSAPGVRERKPLFVGFAESTDRGASLISGDIIDLPIRIYSFKAQNIPEVLEKFMEVRKSLTGPNNPRNLVPFSQVAKFMTQRIDERWYEDENSQFYYPENANWISFGWIGGLMNTFPMIALGDTLHLNRVIKTFDFAIPQAQGKSGYYCGALNYDGSCFSREGYPEFPEIVLSRKNADVLYWMIKQFNLLKKQGKAAYIDPKWDTSMKKLADAFVKTWKKNGQWGRMLNIETGEIAEFVSSGGVMAIGGLALASEYFHHSEYLEIAKEAAGFYYERDFLNEGMTTGGCADILHNADSESAAGFMTSLMSLYEITGNPEWMIKSRNLANLCATWTSSFDYELPKGTELGKLDAKLAGIYWASTQNKHGAPGICTSSGDPLFKIYRSTGDGLYAELLNDIVHAYGESIRPGGFTNERLTYCDADQHSVGNRGNHITGWNELNGFLMALEIPGIYLQTDNDLFYVFDHVEAEIVKRDKTGVVIKIFNPTEFDASVAIFAESAENAKKVLGNNSFMNWPKVLLKSTDSQLVHISIDGTIGN